MNTRIKGLAAILLCLAVIALVVITPSLVTLTVNFAPTPSVAQAGSTTGIGDIAGRHWAAVSVTDTAAGQGVITPVFRAPFNCRIKAISIVPSEAISGADTNNFVLNFHNRGTAGTGTTSLVTAVTFSSGVDVASQDEKSFTLSTTDATITLTSGQVLSMVKTENGSGLATPSMLVYVEFEPK